MQYFEAKPSPLLAGFIKCFWSLCSEAGSGAAEPILPDGCPEIVFNLSDRFRRLHSDGSYETQPVTIVSGQLRSSISIMSTGSVDLFGVRFHPAGAFPFLRMPLSEITDRVEALDSIIGRDGKLIEQKTANANSFEDRVRAFEGQCLESLDRFPVEDDRAQRLSLEISGRKGQISISGLCDFSGIGGRKLERIFKRYIGLSPKTFARVVRFQNVVRRIEAANSMSMLDTALDLGYYDQSHMIREFREFAGKSPLAYFDETHRLSELFTSDHMSDSYNTSGRSER